MFLVISHGCAIVINPTCKVSSNHYRKLTNNPTRKVASNPFLICICLSCQHTLHRVVGYAVFFCWFWRPTQAKSRYGRVLLLWGFAELVQGNKVTRESWNCTFRHIWDLKATQLPHGRHWISWPMWIETPIPFIYCFILQVERGATV